MRVTIDLEKGHHQEALFSSDAAIERLADRIATGVFEMLETQPMLQGCPMHQITHEEALLLHGVIDPNKADDVCPYNTPLHRAAGSGNLPLVRILLRYVSDVNAPNEQFLTPLHFAALGDHVEVIEALLQVEGIGVNAKTRSDQTALQFAEEGGFSDVVALLKPASEKAGPFYQDMNLLLR